MNENLELVKSTGETVQAELICYVENTLNNKRYVYYTLNEMVGSGPSATVKIYVGKTTQGDANLDTPISDEEWDMLKSLMGEVLKNTPNNTVKYHPISELANKNLVSERVIAMPTSYDYINKHKAVYMESLNGTSDNGEVVTPVVDNAPTMESTPVEPTPMEAPAPVVNEPVVEQGVSPFNNPVEPVSTEISESTPMGFNDSAVAPTEPVNNPFETQTTTNQVETLTPINLEEIEQKYQEMLNNLNKLKEQELEAAKRYNATLELSVMHNEQHAEYVANEQNKETTSFTNSVEPAPVEPSPIIPEVPTSSGLETNWFDMPSE